MHEKGTTQLVFLAEDFEDMHTFQFQLDFDENAVEVLDFEPLSSIPFLAKEDNFNTLYDTEVTSIRSVWIDKSVSGQTIEDGTPLLKVTLQQKSGFENWEKAVSLNKKFEQFVYYPDNNDAQPSLQISLNELNSRNRTKNKFKDSFNMYPNPCRDFTTLHFYAAENQEISVSLFDILGKTVIKQQFRAKKGENIIRLDDVMYLYPGIYRCVLSLDGKTQHTLLSKSN